MASCDDLVLWCTMNSNLIRTSGEPLNMSTSKTSSQSAIFTENGQKIYDLAFRLSDAYESFFVGTEHLLLAVLTHKDKAFSEQEQ